MAEKPSNIYENILSGHLLEGALTPGEDIGIKIDQTLTQDATGTMAYLQFESLNVSRVSSELSVSYVDHNTLQQGFENADDLSTQNILEQSISLIAKFPTIIAYAYHSMRHQYHHKPLSIRYPKQHLHTAENFLYMVKGGARYTSLDAKTLDLVLVLHAEHGEGNNSSFTTHVVSSSGTDTYSAIAAAIGFLRGPLHGGANLKVMGMMDNVKENVGDWKDDEEVWCYLMKILNSDAFDGSGKIYGLGHAVYTLSDPRAVLLKEQALELAKEKDRLDEFELYNTIERVAPKAFSEFKGTSAVIAPNVDFYSGFVYDCLGIPREVYTPLFAMARIAGWCAHRLEELISSRKIIRPAYKNVAGTLRYLPLVQRN